MEVMAFPSLKKKSYIKGMVESRGSTLALRDGLAKANLWVGRNADTGRLHDRKNFELRYET